MKRLLVSLDEERYEDLRRLAFEKKASMADLVRYAMEKVFEDQLDLIAIRRGLEEHAADPSGTMTIQEYMESRGLPSRSSSKGAATSRRAAS
jgi:protein-tyrosine-phosphatase